MANAPHNPPMDLRTTPLFGDDGKFVTYEQLLSQNLEWAMGEGSLFFERRGRVQETLERIAKELDDLHIPYAVVGGMALFAHGFRRFTEDVDILVTHQSLIRIHEQLEGHGYLPPFEKSKHLRDTTTRVKIEFLTTGDFPGDGKPKPVAFPDPANVCQEIGGIKFVNLPTLITLKLASGMTHVHRRKDLADVMEVIKTLNLAENFSESLDPYVQPTYQQLWRELNSPADGFLLVWHIANPNVAVHSFDDLISTQPQHAPLLSAMRAAGLEIRIPRKTNADYVLLTTTDPRLAAQFGMIAETDFFDPNEST